MKPKRMETRQHQVKKQRMSESEQLPTNAQPNKEMVDSLQTMATEEHTMGALAQRLRCYVSDDLNGYRFSVEIERAVEWLIHNDVDAARRYRIFWDEILKCEEHTAALKILTLVLLSDDNCTDKLRKKVLLRLMTRDIDDKDIDDGSQ